MVLKFSEIFHEFSWIFHKNFPTKNVPNVIPQMTRNFWWKIFVEYPEKKFKPFEFSMAGQAEFGEGANLVKSREIECGKNS